MQSTRKIIQIDEERCDGCGLCIHSCMEKALVIMDGKAKVISDVLCDGLGACLQSCPKNALTIIERAALPFDVDAVRLLETQVRTCNSSPPHASLHEKNAESKCPSLSHSPCANKPWPLKLRIIPANSPFLKEAPLLLVADCAPAVYPNFHAQHGSKVKLMACPKFEDHELLLQKLIEVLAENAPQSLDTLRMEVPCCSALLHITNEAIQTVQKMHDQALPRAKHEVCNREGQILRDTL